MDDHITDDHLTGEARPRIRRVDSMPKPVRSSAWTWLILFLLVALAAGGIAWLVLRPHAAPAPRGRFSGNGPMPVVVATAQKGDVPVTLNGLGTVTPLATVTVRTQIAGQLMQVAFTEGQEVNKGDFLAQVDPRPYQLALDQLTGQLIKDQALLKNAQLDLARFQKLGAQDSIAKQQVDTQESLVRQDEGTVATDQAMVDNAKLNLAYCHIVAPVSGRVGLRQVDQGNYVQTSDANGIVVITQLKPITVVFTLPEDNLPAIQKQLQAGATLQVTAFDRTRSTKLATGTLLTIDNQIDTTTGTVKLKAQFDNADEVLFPNQFVNAQLLVRTLKDTIIIPTAAIQRGAPGTFVYVVKPDDDTVTVRKVKLGPADGEKNAIESGLEPGDKVVVDGADKLREGAKVTLPAAGNGGQQQSNAGNGGPQQSTAAGGKQQAAGSDGKPPADAPAQPGAGTQAQSPAADQPAPASDPQQPKNGQKRRDGQQRRRSNSSGSSE
jgi:multidrug efflux system membrane fusion protein